MIFQRAEPNEHYRQLHLLDQSGAWELGLTQYASGMRLRMGRVGHPPSVLDFCLGTDPKLVTPVFTAVLRRLEELPISVSAKQIDEAFPWSQTRPNLAVHLEALLAIPSA